MTFRTHYLMIALLAGFGLALGACSSGGDAPEPVAEMPEPTPEPDPGPTDMEETQMAAAAASTAAGEAAMAAAASASAAADATANIATLQTGGTAKASAYAAHAAATDAADASTAATAASAAAAAATTGPDAEAAWAMAVSAQGDAEAAAAMAADMSDAAIEAAKSELHIMGTMKWVDITDEDGSVVGRSSVDAKTGSLTSYDDDGKVTMITGRLDDFSRDVDAIDGVDFDQRGVSAADFTSDGISIPDDTNDNATDTEYVQAVRAGSADIGRELDTSDDMARLTIITAREGTKNVRVFTDRAANNTADGLLTDTGALEDIDTSTDATGTQTASVKSIGSFYEAVNTADTTNNALDAMDEVDPASNPVEVFELSGTVTDGTEANTSSETSYARVVSTTTNNDTGATTVVYRAVDIMAVAAPDAIADGDDNPEEAQVTAALPTADAYDHIHFGVWAGLKDNEGGDNSVIADLGIGFVQNYDGSGVTTGHVTGTAMYSGDWVAVVRPMHSTALSVQDGHATLEANFSTDEFTGTLEDLATLEGSLSGNTFSGTDATVSHADMDASGTFAGSFNGAVYGPDGSEAAGVFSFDGGDSGAFVGAFGGRDDNQ